MRMVVLLTIYSLSKQYNNPLPNNKQKNNIKTIYFIYRWLIFEKIDTK